MSASCVSRDPGRRRSPPRWSASFPQPRHATLAHFLDAAGDPIDIGIALLFPGPHSYTGEHVLELQGHGGPVIVEPLVARAWNSARGARGPVNSPSAPSTTTRSISPRPKPLPISSMPARARLRAPPCARCRVSSPAWSRGSPSADRSATYVEAAIEFPEEEVDFLADTSCAERLATVHGHFDAVTAAAGQGRLLREGSPWYWPAGPTPASPACSIASPATTRPSSRPFPDYARRAARTHRHRRLATARARHAGLRESDDAVEREGVRRAAAEMSRADRVLFVIDTLRRCAWTGIREERERLPREVPVTLIFNKIDLAEGLPVSDTVSGPPRIHVSATTGAGLAALRSHLKGCVSFQTADGSISARKRHLEALTRARECVETAARELQQRRAGELVAEELRLAQRALEEVTGIFTADDLLGRIFGSFCVGK